MSRILCLIFILLISNAGYATDSISIPTVQYVQTVERAIQTKVDTSVTANQTLAGKYVVTGELYVPTPALPPRPTN